jgi:tRNA A-37 threonylcarbamoyl transferase component Bud32
MTIPSSVLLTKAAPGRRKGQVAEHLRRQAVHRLQLVAWFMLTGQLVLWLVINLVQGTLAEEFTDPLEWTFPVGVILASAGIILLTLRSRRNPETVARAGLVYQVVISFGLAAGTYIGAFQGLAPEEFTFDRVGMSFVAPWMLIFSVLVPTPPREALVALLASAAAVPLIYLAQVPSGMAPALPASTFGLIFVLPYLVVVAMAYSAAWVVNQLGVEVRQAYELGSYRLEALLGRGGMGEVWRASHQMLARPAAIKLIRPESLGAEPGLARVRFEREAQAIASLQSPNTVALYDFGSTPEGTLFYVMELLDGVDLEELVRKHGPLPPERVAYMLRQACGSLAEAHARGIMHRDIKPANIYLCRRALEHDVVKLLDFGLVRQIASSAAQAQGKGGPVTRPDLVPGTPAYLAPEIILGAEVDARADVYALGCVAFWLLTGRLVFSATNEAAMLVAHAHTAPASPSRFAPNAVPEALDRLVLDCLAKDPAARPQSANRLRERLSAIAFATPWLQESAAEWWAANRPARGESLERSLAYAD